MTDGLESSTSTQIQNQDTQNIAVTTAESSPSIAQSTQSAESSQAMSKQEKMFSRDEVAKIVNAEKNKALEKERERLKAETVAQVSPSFESPQASDEHVRKLINEEAQRMATMQTAQRIAEEFTQKMVAAKDKYQDFEQTVAKLNLPQIPHIINWANSLDNTADVMYDIAKHPAKFANLIMLAHTAPHLAAEEMQNLSKSIKQNEDAAKRQTPLEPLSQVKPSTTGKDNGSMTVSDYRKQSWLRG